MGDGCHAWNRLFSASGQCRRRIQQRKGAIVYNCPNCGYPRWEHLVVCDRCGRKQFGVPVEGHDGEADDPPDPLEDDE